MLSAVTDACWCCYHCWSCDAGLLPVEMVPVADKFACNTPSLHLSGTGLLAGAATTSHVAKLAFIPLRPSSSPVLHRSSTSSPWLRSFGFSCYHLRRRNRNPHHHEDGHWRTPALSDWPERTFWYCYWFHCYDRGSRRPGDGHCHPPPRSQWHTGMFSCFYWTLSCNGLLYHHRARTHAA